MEVTGIQINHTESINPIVVWFSFEGSQSLPLKHKTEFHA